MTKPEINSERAGSTKDRTKQIQISSEEARARKNERFFVRVKSLNKKLSREVQSTPERYQYLAAKVFSGEASPRERVKLKCFQCANFENITHNVHGCDITVCALHGMRPKAKKKLDS